MTRNDERQQWREFHDFVAAPEMTPGTALDRRINAQIGKALRWEFWQVGFKMTLIQVVTGLATLTICPQFGLGLGDHLSLHAGHVGAPAVLFYLMCGLLFVSCGGLLCGVLLRRSELARAQKMRGRYFLGYACVAYLMLVLLGSEAFVATSLLWIPGAVLGNLAGFVLARSLRLRLV